MSREYKSDVFSMLMENKTYALEVYNALNDTDYTDPEAVETAIDECIREHIFENFILASKDELMNTDTHAPFAALESDPNRGSNR